MKKLLSVVLTIAIILSIGISAFASGGVENAHDHYTGAETSVTDTEKESRAVYCSCGGTFYLSYTTWSAWYRVSKCDCVHGKSWGDDITQERARTVISTCNKCGYGYSTKQTEKRVVCEGYN